MKSRVLPNDLHVGPRCHAIRLSDLVQGNDVMDPSRRKGKNIPSQKEKKRYVFIAKRLFGKYEHTPLARRR